MSGLYFQDFLINSPWSSPLWTNTENDSSTVSELVSFAKNPAYKATCLQGKTKTSKKKKILPFSPNFHKYTEIYWSQDSRVAWQVGGLNHPPLQSGIAHGVCACVCFEIDWYLVPTLCPRCLCLAPGASWDTLQSVHYLVPSRLAARILFDEVRYSTVEKKASVPSQQRQKRKTTSGQGPLFFPLVTINNVVHGSWVSGTSSEQLKWTWCLNYIWAKRGGVSTATAIRQAAAAS